MLWCPMFFVEGEFALGKHELSGDHIWHIKGSKMWIITFHLKQFRVLLNNIFFSTWCPLTMKLVISKKGMTQP